MTFYIFSSQIPGLKELPSDVREEIVEIAVDSLPITWRNCLAVFGVMIPWPAFCLWLSIALGRWILYGIYLPLGVLFISVVLLNLAVPRIQELAQARKQKEGAAL